MDAIGRVHRARVEPLVVDGKIRIRRVQETPSQKAADICFEVLKLEDGQKVWIPNPAGIDPAIAALFPEPIFIGAMENATEDVAKFGAGTTIGKLLKEIMAPVVERHTPAVAQALELVGRQLAANSPEKDVTLTDLDTRIQGELTKLFPGVSAKMHVPVPDFSDFIKSATIKIFEDGFEHADGRDASSFGHGTQRSIQIALIKCLADVKREVGGNAGRTTLLLIDEPELYLHPQAIEVVRVALSRLAEDGYQVVVTTHSANMISRADAPNALLVRRSAMEGTRCYPRLKDIVQHAIDGAVHQSEVLFRLSNSTKILFSERVAITEGKTERTILPAVFDKLFGLTPGEDKLGLVDVGGVNNIIDTMKVLAAMGLPCKAIVDLDFAMRTAPLNGLIPNDHADLDACRQILNNLAGAGQVALDDHGWPRRHAGGPASAGFELLAQHSDAVPCIGRLYDALIEHGIWVWKRGTIESHLGIQKSTAAKMAFIAGLENDAFIAARPDYATVTAAMAWLRA
uniref:ATP-dependent nuclease n=1 Tax=Paracoccus sp. T5 TaxID=3402161 RepID=UPI003ADBCC53